MTTDLDIYRSARTLITQHGEDAPIHAAMRADELLKAGDMDGLAVWKRILKAVDELLAKERPKGAAVMVFRPEPVEAGQCQTILRRPALCPWWLSSCLAAGGR